VVYILNKCGLLTLNETNLKAEPFASVSIICIGLCVVSFYYRSVNYYISNTVNIDVGEDKDTMFSLFNGSDVVCKLSLFFQTI